MKINCGIGVTPEQEKREKDPPKPRTMEELNKVVFALTDEVARLRREISSLQNLATPRGDW